MSAPNEFVPSTSHTFHHEGVASLVIQAAHSNSNFPAVTNTNGGTSHFNGGGFFPNNLGYDVAMLPLFHHTSQRPAHFNAASFQKPVQAENTSKQELSHIPAADGRSNVFNTEATNCPSPVQYWSRQSQLSPFGVLPHEISPDQMDESKSPYENHLNTHFGGQPINNLNPMAECDKKTQVIVSGKAKEVKRPPAQYMKLNEVKMNSGYGQDDMNFRNDVINHVGQKVDPKMVNYKKNELIGHLPEPVNTVPQDYRVFKPPNLFPNAAAPVVKYTGKPTKQYVPKQMPDKGAQPIMKNQRMGSSSPMMQKMDFQDDSQSSPISLTSDDCSEHRYSSPSEVPIKEIEPEAYSLSHMNAVPPNASVPTGYRELPDRNCHNGDQNKVTPQFLKLPYAPANAQNSVVPECHANRKSQYGSVYIMYNNAVPSHQKPEKLNERVEPPVQQPSNIKLNNVHENHSMKPMQNGLVGYPSVIMRTDRNYEAEDKDKSPRRMQWPGPDRAVVQPAKTDKLYRDPNAQLQTTLPDHQHLLLGLTERQHSYFDTTPCPPMNTAKCSPKHVAKNVYEEQRMQEQHQQPHPQEQLHHYQYLAKPQPPLEAQPEVTDKLYPRRRKPLRSNGQSGHPLHMMENRVPPQPTMTEYAASRDPPPAHGNLYPQVQNANYMDGNRYETAPAMAKLYPSQEQFYSQGNLNYNVTPMANMAHDGHHHQSVIASHGASARLSPAQQARQMSPVSSSLPLSAYFSSFHPSSHYAHHEFAANPGVDSAQSFGLSETPAAYPETTREKECESRVRVIMPSVEEEFKFLFDPTLPHYKQIASFEEEELYKTPAGKPTFYRKNIDFQASYVKFLENNCESVETLTDSSTNTMKNWNRTKVVYQPVVRDETPAKEPEKAPVKEPECNFENDPRYYPLPKSSDKRRLCDSSSDEEPDEHVKKKPVAPPKKPAEAEKKKAPPVAKSKKKQVKPEKRKESKKKKEKKEPKTEIKTVKSKLEKLEKAKQRIEKLRKKNYPAEKLKSKMDKALAEINAIKQAPAVAPKKKPAIPAKDQKAVPRRKGSERKAKDEVKSKMKGAIDSDDDEQSSNDSDPSWTPRDDDEDSGTKRRSTRMRSVRFAPKASKKSGDQSSKHSFPNNLSSKKDAKKEAVEPLKVSKTSKKSTAAATDSDKIGQFYMLKSPTNRKRLELWCLKNGKLQRFVQQNQNGKQLFSSSSEMVKLTEVDLSEYQETGVVVVESRKNRVVVELRDEVDVPTDTKIKENFMKESLCYENQFAVYIQTLVSQALDSNFLSEVVKENDVYFLNSMKVIDDVTATYLDDLTSVVNWGAGSVDLVVKTWPHMSMKNIRNESCHTTCAGCTLADAKQTAIFYGQPYVRETLQGCPPNSSIPDNLDKTVSLCGGCARKIKLFNKIWHQKYHVFVECAKYVSKKKSENKNKGTTDVLNELLADTVWLSKLFYDIRNTWLQIWTLVRRTKKS